MTARELIMAILINGSIEDEVVFESRIPENANHYLIFSPKHVAYLSDDYGKPEVLIECEPNKEEQ